MSTGLLAVFAGAAGAYVYFIGDNATIDTAQLDGTNVQTLPVVDDDDNGNNGRSNGPIAVDGSHVYWTSCTGSLFPACIKRAALDGTGKATVISADPIYGFAVDAPYLYWSSENAGSGQTIIGRSNLDGSGQIATLVSIPGSQGPAVVAAGGGFVYWASSGTGGARIGRASSSGGAPNFDLVTLPPSTQPMALAVGPTRIYWIDADNRQWIGSANLDGSNPDPHFISVGGSSGAGSLATDSNYLYWGPGQAEGEVGRARLDGSGANPAFLAVAGLGPVAVDAGSGDPTSTTSLHCTPVRKFSLQSTTCTATVIDEAANPTLPLGGHLVFSFSLTQSRASTGCLLTASGPRTSSCTSPSFAPIQSWPQGGVAVTASYLGETTHVSSSTAGALPQFTVCEVPKVTGLRIALARKAIKASFCGLGKTRRIQAGRRRRGLVISQSPKSSTKLRPPGTRVSLVVGR